MHAINLSLGQLVAALVDQYESLYHDQELAALAAEVELTEYLMERDEFARHDEFEVAA